MRKITVLKKFTVMLLLTYVCILGAGCNNNEKKAGSVDSNRNNLNFEKVTIEQNENNNSYESYDYAGVTTIWIDSKLDLNKILEEGKEPPYTFNNNVVYKGGELTYRVWVHNYSSENETITYFMNANGNMQPFRTNDGEESDYYMVSLKPNEDKDLVFKFKPLYAPAEEKGKITIFSYAYMENNDELDDVIKKNVGNYNAAFAQRMQIDCKDISIQADSKTNEKNIDICENKIGSDSDKIFCDDTGNPLNQTNGVTFGEKYTDAENNGMINFNVKWKITDKLYARALCYGKSNVRIFLLMDGKLIPAFNGKYFADFYQKTGVVHNISIDSEVLQEEGNHIVQGFIYYKEPNDEADIDVDALSTILLELSN